MDTHPVAIGCSGWSYDDWVGPFYPDGARPDEYLEFYADRFPIVEVDSSFYRPPTPRMVRGWRDRTPKHFKFCLKVPRSITHEKQLRDCRQDVDEFLVAIAPLGEKVHSCLLQMGYFNRSAFAGLDTFLPVLDDFLANWPIARIPLAVEIRNPRWLVPEFADLLRHHGAVFVLNDQSWMPRPAEVAAKFDPITGPLGFVRLVGDRERIEKVTQTWDKIVVDRNDDLQDSADMLKAIRTRVPSVVFVANHFAGYAPETARQLRAMLGISEPAPPDRPRTTLFD